MTAGAALALCGVEGTNATEPAKSAGFEDTPFVCAQVVLAVDGSESTRESAFQRQVESLRAAFEREQLYHAIQDCLPGSVVFAAMTWSGPEQQELCLDWSLVTTPNDGQHLAEQFEKCRYFGGSTNIGRAVDSSLRMLEESPFASYYRIVLILTNGRTDRGTDAGLLAARARAEAAGVTVTGYALLRPLPKNPSPFFVPGAVQLDRYVAERVSAGPRTFTAHSRPEDDAEALLRALVEMLRQEAG